MINQSAVTLAVLLGIGHRWIVVRITDKLDLNSKPPESIRYIGPKQ